MEEYIMLPEIKNANWICSNTMIYTLAEEEYKQYNIIEYDKGNNTFGENKPHQSTFRVEPLEFKYSKKLKSV